MVEARVERIHFMFRQNSWTVSKSIHEHAPRMLVQYLQIILVRESDNLPHTSDQLLPKIQIGQCLPQSVQALRTGAKVYLLSQVAGR